VGTLRALAATSEVHVFGSWPLRVLAACFALAAAGCGQGERAAADAPAAKDAPGENRAFEVERSAVHTVRSAKLDRTYEIYVKTPPGYDRPENAQRRYPVLYLTDGPYTFQVASGATRVPFNQGRLEEFVLVGLSYAQGEDAMVSRRRDYTPFDTRAHATTSGEAAAYLDHLRTEVLPLAEARYRIDGRRRTLSGQSYGALFGLWAALTEPELFSSYILTSSSIWSAGHSLFKTEAAYAAGRKDLPATIYLAIGSVENRCEGCSYDMVADQAELVRRLRARNYPSLRIRSDVIEGAIHELTYPVGLVHGLQWLFADGAARPRR